MTAIALPKSTLSLPVGDLQFLYRTELTDNRWNQKPRVHAPNGSFRLRWLIDGIQSNFGSLDNVLGAVLFGSAIIPHTFEETYTEGMWWWKQTKTRTVAKKPHDYDVLVFLKEAPLCTEAKADLALSSIVYNEYGNWFSDAVRSNALHLFATTNEEFSKALAEGKSEAVSVMNNGVLLFGQIPFALKSPLRARWAEGACDIK